MNTNEMVLIKEENVFLFEIYFSTKCYKTCTEKIAKKFYGRRPNKTSILQLVHCFREDNTVIRAPYPLVMRITSTPANVAEVREKFQTTPSVLFC